VKRALIMLVLTGCASTPEVALDPMAPPEVTDCLQHRTPDLMPPPIFIWELPEFLVTAVYILTEERRLRGIERECIADKKAEGIIR
jgi:hypothetical protein